MTGTHKSETAIEIAADDLVLPFTVDALGVRGRVVRLGAVVDDIIQRHDYPAPVSALLAEAVGLTTLLGSALKFDGKFILQTSSDGPVSMLVADYTTPGIVRGYVQFDGPAVAALEAAGAVSQATLFGTGHLAMTIDQGRHTERYQGIVPLDQGQLGDAAHAYFAQSEQIPTRLVLTAGPLAGRGSTGQDNWRAGAIMVQHLPADGSISPIPFSSGDAPDGHVEELDEDDNWVKAKLLVETVEFHELLDPTITPETLLYRLFHEDGARVFPAQTVTRGCSCSRERVSDMLDGFSPEERAEMVEGDTINVTCEFCSTQYRFPVE
jgi:molecular chaperone Hsp33